MEQTAIKGIEVQFEDLTQKKQEELYEQQREEFEEEAANSQYETIRQKVIENTTSEDILDTIFALEVESYGSIQNIKALWKHPNFERTQEKRKILADSDNWECREIVAKDEESSSEFLNQMLRKEVKKEHDTEVRKAIRSNSKFQMEEESLEVLAKSDNWYDRRIAAEDKKSSSGFLNKMFQREVKGERDEDVMKAIQDNPNFEMEEESEKVLQNEIGLED